MSNLTQKEKQALSNYWRYSLKVKDGQVLAKKSRSGAWGVLYFTIDEAKKNAQMILGTYQETMPEKPNKSVNNTDRFRL